MHEIVGEVFCQRVREAAGCTRLCSLSSTLRVLQLAERLTHNGVSFSHTVDIDRFCWQQAGAERIADVIVFWCREHHAGRDGHEMPISRDDGGTDILMIPEAVD